MHINIVLQIEISKLVSGLLALLFVPGDTQIGPHHRRCAFDLGGRAFRDFLPMVEHNYTIAQAHDHPHIVLD